MGTFANKIPCFNYLPGLLEHIYLARKSKKVQLA